MYYVYVLSDQEGKLYMGYSTDLKARLRAHNEGRNRSTKNRTWQLVYYEAFRSGADARAREKSLKNSGQARRWLKERIQKSMIDGRKS